MDKVVTAYIGLGGNVGDVFNNMRNALRALNTHEQISVRLISDVYKTPPWGIEEQDWFLNACVSVKSSLSGRELLQECLDTEKQLNRVREVRWGPRTIDLDVLFYGDESIDEKELQVPHPRMHERGFVLLPMADIAPNLVLRGKTIKIWLEQLETSEIQKTELVLTL